MEGEDGREVGRAKNCLERLVSGTVVTQDGKAVWTPSFPMNGTSYQKLKIIERDFGVVLVRNLRQSTLLLFGPAEKCEEAQKQVADLGNQEEQLRRAIVLDQDQFAWACRGGFKAIVDRFGEDAIGFDIISVPKRIYVTGPNDVYRAAKVMVNNQDVPQELPDGKETSDTECAICWTQADNPIQTQCEHTYCTDCFERLCFAGESAGEEFCIRCEGDLGKCAAVPKLDEVQSHLSSSTFEDLLNAAFSSHVRRHPQSLRNCPTPECTQVYRVSVDRIALTCPSCLAVVCTTCHESHPGVTCAEHRDIASGGYEALAKAKIKLGIKGCPSCKTAIEKTEGCDHMTCGGCGTHICWKFMQVFKNSRSCYDHMNQVHESIVLEFPGIA